MQAIPVKERLEEAVRLLDEISVFGESITQDMAEVRGGDIEIAAVSMRQHVNEINQFLDEEAYQEMQGVKT